MNTDSSNGMPRRQFIKTAATAGIVTVSPIVPNANSEPAPSSAGAGEGKIRAEDAGSRRYAQAYQGAFLNRVAFPMGGIGAGMICLEGNGLSLSFFAAQQA